MYYTDYNNEPPLNLLTGATANQVDGFILYTDQCTTPAANVVLHNAVGAAFTTNQSGVITGHECGT
jgi:hypothetical protein